MPDDSLRLSVELTGQSRDAGAFPAMRTYPASVERYLTGGKIYAATGTGAGSLPIGGTLTKITAWYVESAGGSVTVADGPVNGTVPAGECVVATNAVGWTAGTVTITGTGSYKVIAYGE